MAIFLDPSGNDQIDYGDLSEIDGLTEFSIAIDILPTATLATGRVTSKWGNAETTDQAFLNLIASTGEVQFGVEGDTFTSDFSGRQTGAGTVVNGTRSKILMTWKASPKEFHIFHNGVDESLSTWLDDNSPAAIDSNTDTGVQLGHQTDAAAAGFEANYSEVAMWSVQVPDWMGLAYTGGNYSPLFFREGMFLHSRLTNTADTRDMASGFAGSLTGGANAAHGPMVYPAMPHVLPWTTAAPAGVVPAPYYYTNLLAG